MTEMKVLREWYPITVEPKTLKEGTLRRSDRGNIVLGPGIIQAADKKNANKRVYPERILKRELENYSKAISERRALGELDHPERSVVNYENVSHVITNAYWDGKNVMGEIEVLENLPKGKILKGLVEAGIPIGISSRGVGSTSKKRIREGGEDDEVDEVNDDYQIICWDVVSEPSTHGAYVFREGREIRVDQREMYSKADRIFRALNHIVRK